MSRRGWWRVAVLSIVHFVAQTAALVSTIGSGLARFDHGGEPTALEQIGAYAAAALQFPLVSLARALPWGGSGQWSWAILLANSVLWGMACAAAWGWASGRRTPRGRRPGDAPMAAS